MNVSISFEIAYVRLLRGARETSHLLFLIEKYKNKIDDLAKLSRELFNIRNLSNEDMAIIAIGYLRGQTDFTLEIVYVSRSGSSTITEELNLEKDEYKKQIIKQFLKGKGGKRDKSL